MTGTRDRARGALLGLALGDALGMPTQALAPQVVRARYGLLDGFRPAPDDNPISAGLAAGRVTDDTDQAVIVGQLLVAGRGHVDPLALAQRLIAWEAQMRSSGSLDLLGPSTRTALDRLSAGISPLESGAGGTTNGAAMRIAPVGIACDIAGAGGLAALVDLVAEVSRPTHNTAVAVAGAAAVAAGVSGGVAGRSIHETVDLAIEAAALAEGAGGRLSEPARGLAGRIRTAVELVAGCDIEAAMDRVIAEVGTSLATEESVPAAVALASLMADGDPWLVVRAAASLGGDSDTIAAMAGAMAGAVAGAAAFPAAAVRELTAANPTLALDELADALLALCDNGFQAHP